VVDRVQCGGLDTFATAARPVPRLDPAVEVSQPDRPAAGGQSHDRRARKLARRHIHGTAVCRPGRPAEDAAVREQVDRRRPRHGAPDQAGRTDGGEAPPAGAPVGPCGGVDLVLDAGADHLSGAVAGERHRPAGEEHLDEIARRRQHRQSGVGGRQQRGVGQRLKPGDRLQGRERPARPDQPPVIQAVKPVAEGPEHRPPAAHDHRRHSVAPQAGERHGPESPRLQLQQLAATSGAPEPPGSAGRERRHPVRRQDRQVEPFHRPAVPAGQSAAKAQVEPAAQLRHRGHPPHRQAVEDAHRLPAGAAVAAGEQAPIAAVDQPLTETGAGPPGAAVGPQLATGAGGHRGGRAPRRRVPRVARDLLRQLQAPLENQVQREAGDQDRRRQRDERTSQRMSGRRCIHTATAIIGHPIRGFNAAAFALVRSARSDIIRFLYRSRRPPPDGGSIRSHDGQTDRA